MIRVPRLRENAGVPGHRKRAMPLSEEEQRILSEIEAQLSASDPALAQQVSETTVYKHAARAIRWAVLGFIAGLVIMLFTFTTTWVLGALGFGLMLASTIVIVEHLRKMGRAGLASMTGSSRAGGLRGALSDRTRWKDRFKRPGQP